MLDDTKKQEGFTWVTKHGKTASMTAVRRDVRPGSRRRVHLSVELAPGGGQDSRSGRLDRTLSRNSPSAAKAQYGGQPSAKWKFGRWKPMAQPTAYKNAYRQV